MNYMFRALRADEVECRVATINEKGCSLLLYKDARCDMNILDETVGPMNWQRRHTRDNANCIVSIWDESKGQWIEKEDTGTESNTEKEKGLASDSFKRACFNIGIGRELYTAPFIWVPEGLVTITEKNGKKNTYDTFSVVELESKDKVITRLVIKNNKTKKEVYTFGTGEKVKAPAQEKAEDSVEAFKERLANSKRTENQSTKKFTDMASAKQVAFLEKRYKGDRLDKVLDFFKVESLSLLTSRQASDLIQKIIEKENANKEATT